MSEVGKINPEMSSDEMEYFIYKQCKEIVKNKIIQIFLLLKKRNILII